MPWTNQSSRPDTNPQAKRGYRKMRQLSAPTAAQRAQLQKLGGRGRPNAQRGRRS